MTDTLWTAILIALTLIGARLAKCWPKLPKGLMPALALGLGAGLYVAKAVYCDGVAPIEALLSWQVLIAGAGAIVGHDLLKGALGGLLGEERAATLLGRLPAAGAAPGGDPAPKEPKPSESLAPVAAADDPPEEPAGGGGKPGGVSGAIFIGLLALLLAGCSATGLQIQARTADAIAMGANAGLPTLIGQYREEGRAVIAAATTREEAEQKVAEVKQRWRPVWTAWEALRAAQDAWATALEHGGDLAGVLATMKVAYCGLRAAWPASVPALPLVPIQCEGSP
jgi:hypothetical protein